MAQFTYTPLYEACRTNNVSVEKVEELLKCGHDPNDDGNFHIVPHSFSKLAKMGCKEYRKVGTPLDIAVECKNLQKVRVLLKHDTISTKYVIPPVVKAMLEEDLLELQRLAKTDGDFKAGLGELTPLKIAIELEDWDYFYLLMLKDIVPKDKGDVFALIFEDIMRKNYKVSPRSPCKFKTRFEFHMKYYDSDSGHYYRVKNGCLNIKERLEQRYHFFYNDLIRLIEELGYYQNKLKRIPSILEVTKPNRHFRERTHLKMAIRREDVNTVKFLVKQPCIDVNYSRTRYSPLHSAVDTGNVTIVNLLLSHKDIDVNAMNYEMQTPLITCFEKKERLRKEIKEILEDKIPSITLEMKKRRTIRLPPLEFSPGPPTLKVYGEEKIDEEDEEDEDEEDAEEEEDEEEEEEEEEEDLLVPVPRLPTRATQTFRWRMGYLLPECNKEQKRILGSIDPDSLEAEEKLIIYWIEQIEKEKQVLLEKVAQLQKEVDDQSIENALRAHPNICLRPRFSFRLNERNSGSRIELCWFGSPHIDRQHGKGLWNACLNGNLFEVKRLMDIQNIDLYYAQGIYDNNEGFNEGLSPLHIASHLGYDEIVSILLSHPDMNVNVPVFFESARYDMFNDAYPWRTIIHEMTPIALAKTPKIHQMIRDHPSFDLQRNMNFDGGRYNQEYLSIPISELIPFYRKHESNPHIIPFIDRQLVLSYNAKTTPLSDQELVVFKTLLDYGAVFGIQSIHQDDPDLVSLCLQYKPNNLLSAFNHFAKTSFSKSIDLVAKKFSWAEVRTLSKSKRHIPSDSSRKLLYLHRIRPVEVWALNNIKPRLNSNVASKIAGFLLD